MFDSRTLTGTRDSVSRVARVARAVERALGVGTVGVWVAVVRSSKTLVDIYSRNGEN